MSEKLKKSLVVALAMAGIFLGIYLNIYIQRKVICRDCVSIADYEKKIQELEGYIQVLSDRTREQGDAIAYEYDLLKNINDGSANFIRRMEAFKKDVELKLNMCQ